MDFSKHLQKAEEALRRRNFDFAVDLYRQLLDLDADLGEARAGLRDALKRRQESKPRSKLMGALGGALPLGRARTLFKLKKYDSAAKALEDYLAHSPFDEDANLLLGESLELAGHKNSARAVYEFVAEVAPKNPEGLKRAGAMMMALGDHGKALGYFERALEVDPRDQEALKARKNLAAEAALTKGNFEGVRHSREQLVDAEETRRLERTRRSHLGEDELREELTRLEGRFADEPKNLELMLEIAAVHERLRDPAAALELAERALSYRHGDFDLQTRVADLRVKVLRLELRAADKAGDRDKADRLERELDELELTDLRRRVEARPSEAPLRLALARRLVRGADWDGALAELQRAGGDPRVARDVSQLKGQCFEAKGYLDLAVKELSAALEGLAPGEDRAKELGYQLGAIAERQGRAEEARSWYARVFEQDIGFRDVAQKMESLRDAGAG